MWGTGGKLRELKINLVGAIMHEPFPPLLWRWLQTVRTYHLALMMQGIGFPVRMQSRWCRAWQLVRPNLTDFVHIFSKRGYLQCVFVHWRDLESKSKSTAYLLENWNSSTTAPDALFSPWWASTASSDRLCCSLVVLPLRCCFECLHSPRVPTLGKSPFSPRGLLMSTQHCLVFVLGFQSWRVDSRGDKSKLRSIEVKVRGPTLPATRSNHRVGYGDNRV